MTCSGELPFESHRTGWFGVVAGLFLSLRGRDLPLLVFMLARALETVTAFMTRLAGSAIDRRIVLVFRGIRHRASMRRSMVRFHAPFL